MGSGVTYHDFILLNVGRASHHADWNWKNVWSPFARIHYVAQGKAKIIRGTETYDLKENHLYLTPSYTTHSYSCQDDLSLYYIHIYEKPGYQLSIFDSFDFPAEIEADALSVALIERLAMINPARALQYYDPDTYDNSSTLMKNIAFQKRVPMAFEMETQGILKQLIAKFVIHASEKHSNMDPRILQSLHYIHTNIDKPISIDLLADQSFLTKDHFIRLFRKYLNCTPGKYINRKKIEKAQLMLLINQTSVKDLSYNLGFENPAYFNRVFKKITGHNPGEHRKGMRISDQYK